MSTMKNLEKEFLQVIESTDILTPQNVTLVDNEGLPNKLVQYCVEIKDKQFHIIVERNRSEILALGKDGVSQNNLKDGEQLYQELRQKARVWYREEDLSKYVVMFNNTRCKVHLDIYSWIPPFVLKSIEDINTRFIGLDFLTVYSLINVE